MQALGGGAVCEPLQGHSDQVLSVAYSPDGRKIVSGSADHSIRVWDAGTGKAVCKSLEGHSGIIWSVAYSPNGRHIVSGSLDSTIRVWDAEIEDSVSMIPIAFSSNPNHALSGIDLIIPPDMESTEHQGCSMYNGHVLGPKGQLLFWLPPEYCDRLWWPHTKFILGHETAMLDLSQFTHGTSWHHCHSGS